MRQMTSYRDDAGEGSLHSPHGHCPSSWHASTDRHSPVFPSSHLTQKFTHRERHHPQTATPDAKRRKLVNTDDSRHSCDMNDGHHQSVSCIDFYSNPTEMEWPYEQYIAHGRGLPSTKFSHTDQNLQFNGNAIIDYHYGPCPQYLQPGSDSYVNNSELATTALTNQISSNNVLFYGHIRPCPIENRNCYYRGPADFYEEQFNCESSSVPLPTLYPEYGVFQSEVHNAFNNPNGPHDSNPAFIDFNQSAVNLMTFCDDGTRTGFQIKPEYQPEMPNNQPYDQSMSFPVIDVKSHCSISVPIHFEISQNVSVCISGNQTHHQPSCALAANKKQCSTENVVPKKEPEQDARHMEIVEHETNTRAIKEQCNEDPNDLPSIGSFLEFLENAQ